MCAASEIIRLDAVIVAVLSEKAFRARLANGHEFVAYLPANPAEPAANVGVGDRVIVAMSPFDMSKGKISGKAGE